MGVYYSCGKFKPFTYLRPSTTVTDGDFCYCWLIVGPIDLIWPVNPGKNVNDVKDRFI